MSDRFPTSYFSEETLRGCADRFTIPNRFYNADTAPMIRSGAVLTADERRYIQQELTYARMAEIWELYYKLTSFDINFLIPRLPITVVMQICDLNKADASALKRAGNTLRDIPTEEYNARVQACIAAQVNKVSEGNTYNFAQPKPDNTEHMTNLGKMRRFLNAKQVLKMPKDIGCHIHTVPEYLVKRAWTGPQFNTAYKKAKAFYPAPKQNPK
ncbi:MAG: hypothetical protein K2F99_00080 [Muribaculaceae bacterium]|nr:hypothetical protein [Muribaculaceae bacterium]